MFPYSLSCQKQPPSSHPHTTTRAPTDCSLPVRGPRRHVTVGGRRGIRVGTRRRGLVGEGENKAAAAAAAAASNGGDNIPQIRHSGIRARLGYRAQPQLHTTIPGSQQNAPYSSIALDSVRARPNVSILSSVVRVWNTTFSSCPALPRTSRLITPESSLPSNYTTPHPRWPGFRASPPSQARRLLWL